MKKKGLKVIELFVEPGEVGINAMGFVEFPATEEEGYYFDKEKHNVTFAKETEEEGLFVSPAMIANKEIYRFDQFTNEEYYVFFSPETIKSLSTNFMVAQQNTNVNEEHEEPIQDVTLVYSWIVENDQDPIMTKYGFKDISIGSWVTMYKINNEDIKAKIKSGEINGVSIEGYFTDKFSKQLSDEQLINKIRELLSN